MKINRIRHCCPNLSAKFCNYGGSKPRDRDEGMGKAYNPRPVEGDWYEWWEKNGYFMFRENHPDTPTFSMILPPPNVTGTLHLGHALTVTIQDVLARWNRMRGREVVWVPGTDHAGIATQAIVERIVKRRTGKTRHDLGRNQFLGHVWKWKDEKEGRITEQLKKLGASLDWNREFFTMDKNQSEAVSQAVISLWEEGLIYKGESLVNWSCELRSAISDIEVDYLTVSGPTSISVPGYSDPVTFGQITDFAYKFENMDDEVIVSTTRVETVLGDTAVAVHPSDSRYSSKIGARLRHPFTNSSIPLISDSRVNPRFGTGAVKITPGHNQMDFDIGKTHNLPFKTVINEEGVICNSEHFSGLKRFDARDAIIGALNDLGLLRGVKEHSMEVPLCSRSGDVVELLLKPQWFIKCNGMAEKASRAVRDGLLLIEPSQFEKNWFSWLDNIRDWCISRQLWWGHQLPLYLCRSNTGSLYVGALSEEEALSKAKCSLEGDVTVTRETDVLDTWFSSALLPSTVFGWPKQNEDLEKLFPLSTMVTGHDIMFFWVARMVMLCTHLTGKLPFKRVLLHGIVCDSQGRKMSKSLGNVVDPEDIIKGITLEDLEGKLLESCSNGIITQEEAEKAKSGLKSLFPNGLPECGADALRYTLLSHRIKNHYINFNISECHANRLFCNKIWQACRFAFSWEKTLGLNLKDYSESPESNDVMDKWILSELSVAVNITNSALEASDFHLAVSALRDFLYTDLCDVYLEYTKPILKGNCKDKAMKTLYILLFCLDSAVRALSPLMPYLSEELYTFLPGRHRQSIMDEQYPINYEWENPIAKEHVKIGQDIVAAIRKMKVDNGIKLKQKLRVWIVGDRVGLSDLQQMIETLASCDATFCRTLPADEPPWGTLINPSLQVFISSKDLSGKARTSDKEARRKKLEKELNKIIRMKSNEGYSNVSSEIQAAHSEKVARLKSELSKILTEI